MGLVWGKLDIASIFQGKDIPRVDTQSTSFIHCISQ